MVEVVLIVVGVLLAFSIESRWQGFQQDRQSAAYLAGVVGELEQNRVVLEALIQLNARSGRAADSLLTIVLEGTPVTDSMASDLLWRATSVQPFQPSTIALESLVNSTAWADLNDPDLRARLARLDASLSSIQGLFRTRSDYWFRSFNPYLRTRIDYAAWSDRRSAPGVDWQGLLRDREFRNLLIHSGWFSGSDAPPLEDALSQLSGILELLDEGRTN